MTRAARERLDSFAALAITTLPFMPPPFLDIVIAVIFGVGVVDLVVGFLGAIAGKAELVGVLA